MSDWPVREPQRALTRTSSSSGLYSGSNPVPSSTRELTRFDPRRPGCRHGGLTFFKPKGEVDRPTKCGRPTFTLSYDGKVVALACDNQLYMKPTAEGRAF
jgi:hypothetical protein